MQLIRSTIAPNRTHIIQPSAVTVTNNAGNAQITNIFGQQSGQQSNIGGSTTISVPATSGSGNQQTQQPTYVATVLPQRPQATFVYTSQQQQPFTAIQGPVQRMGITNSTINTRQVRPIQRIPTTGIRVNTSSLSIRPNVPGLTPTVLTQNRNMGGGLVAGTSTTISNTIPARILQVATSMSQTQSGGSQQIIGQQNQKILQGNVMTLPIIVNNRIGQTVKTPLQPGIIAHVSKLTPGSVSSDGTIISNSITTTIPSTMVASIQAGQQSQSAQLQVSQGSNQQQGSSYSSQPAQVTNITNQSGSQIITVSQQQQQQIIAGQGNIHQQNSNVSTVVPLQIAARGGNIPIKTITVSTANSGNLDASNIHRNLSSNTGSMQATTIMPIAKIVQSQQQQNISQNSNQPTSVFIQTRIPSSTITTTNSSQVVNVSAPSSTIFSSAGTTVFYEQASVSIAPSSSSSIVENKTTSSSAPNNESSSYTVVSAPNMRYTDKMIQSLIAANSFQSNSGSSNQQSSSNQHPQTIRYSPLVVESQSAQQSQGNQSHQIITMPQGLVQQQTIAMPQQQSQQQQQIQTSIENSVITALPASPRSVGAIRKQNETTPVKVPKKAAKVC